MSSAIVKMNIKTNIGKIVYDVTNVILIKNYNNNKDYSYSHVIFESKYRIRDLAYVYFDMLSKSSYGDFLYFDDSIAEAQVNKILYTGIEDKNWKGSAYVSRKANTDIKNDKWYAYANILRSQTKDFGILARTKKFDRFNSNIYKNIFEHILFDLYKLQKYLVPKPYKQYNNIFQPNHGFELHDLVYMNQYGIYGKCMANNYEYDVIGIVTEILNNNEFVLMTYGEIELDENTNISSDSSILYLSDTNYGKYDVFENINSNFYTPIGFVNDNKIVINIMDSSVGDNLKLYQDQIFVQNLNFLTQQDREYVINEVINNS